MGTTNKPFFRIVAADERTSNNGRFLETLGWYAPKRKGINYEMDLDRIAYWKGVGARTTETVDSLLKKARKQGAKSTPQQEMESAEESPKKVKKVADLPPEEKPAEPPAPAAEADTDAEAKTSAPESEPVAEAPAAEDSAKEDEDKEVSE